MKVLGYLWCVLGLASVMSTIGAINLQEGREDQLLLDAMSAADSARTKKPFCNAFTGCGKKRSYPENFVEDQEHSVNNIRIPVPIYRALLRAASGEIEKTLDHESRVKNADVVDYAYSNIINKIPHQDRYQS